MVVDDLAAGWIDVSHAENAQRIQRAHRVLEVSGAAARLERIEPRFATRDELSLVHTDAHIDRIERAGRSGSLEMVGPEARFGPESREPALLAAGAGLACVDYAMSEPNGRAYALTRPPGHHASADQAMGFCLFNNAALAARYARARYGVGRVAILDWDVHHGNGTQEIFYEDPEVLFISIHQDRLYPADMGTIGERGSGAGLGANVNVPLPAGSGDAGYLTAMSEVVLPSLAAFRPDLVVLSSGQDAAASDPLGRMSVTTEGFRRMTAQLVEFTEAECDGRTIALQEGGYSIDHMPFCVLATVEALASLEPALEGDPIELDVPVEIGPSETEAVRAARSAALG